jgi:hypothetical protein
MTRTVNNDWSPDSDTNLENLADGLHYNVCYLTVTENYIFELGQFYLAKESRTVSPSDISTFIIVGLEVQIHLEGGDEAFGEIIRFSEN